LLCLEVGAGRHRRWVAAEEPGGHSPLHVDPVDGFTAERGGRTSGSVRAGLDVGGPAKAPSTVVSLPLLVDGDADLVEVNPLLP